MRIIESPDTLKRYRRTTWEFQQTFHTPLKNLTRFVEVITSAIPEIEGAQTAFDLVVFEPRYDLVALCAKYSLPKKLHGDGLMIEAQGATEVRELLESALSEWIDFLFVPMPRRFVIFADHDEHITFLAHRKGQLNGIVETLTAAKFRAVEYLGKH